MEDRDIPCVCIVGNRYPDIYIEARIDSSEEETGQFTFVSIVGAHVCQYVSWTTSSRSKNVRSANISIRF